MTDAAATPATTWTPETLADRIKRADSEQLESALEVAVTLLEGKLAGAWRPVPVEVYDLMVLRVVRAVLEGDTRQYTGPASTQLEAGQRVQAPRDPLEVVRPLIAAYVVGLA